MNLFMMKLKIMYYTWLIVFISKFITLFVCIFLLTQSKAFFFIPQNVNLFRVIWTMSLSILERLGLKKTLVLETIHWKVLFLSKMGLIMGVHSKIRWQNPQILNCFIRYSILIFFAKMSALFMCGLIIRLHSKKLEPLFYFRYFFINFSASYVFQHV